MSQALLYPPLVNNLSKQINADYTAGATTVTLNNTTSIQNKGGTCVVNRVNSGGTRQPAANWTYLKFTGTSGATLTGVTAISGDQDHGIGEVVEFVPEVTQQQAILEDLSNLVDPATGAVDLTKVVTPGDTQTLTAKTLTSPTINGTTTYDTDAQASITALAPSTASLSRQAIINGNFSVWQRGVSFTTNPVYTADRWTYYDSGASRAVTRDTDVPDISSLYSLKTVVATGGSNKVALITQKVEGSSAGRFSGKNVTISFYVKASAAAGTLNGGLIYVSYASALDNFTTTEYAVGTSFTPTTAWQLVTKTLTLPATSPATYSIANGFSVNIQVGCTDNTNLTARFAQIQLCTGDVALPFQPKSYEEELAACQRYCYGVTTTSVTESVAYGVASSTTVCYPHLFFPVEMRTTPTLPVATAADWQLDNVGESPFDVTALVIDDMAFTSKKIGVLKASVASGLTAYRNHYLVGDGNAGRTLIFDAEL